MYAPLLKCDLTMLFLFVAFIREAWNFTFCFFHDIIRFLNPGNLRQLWA